MFDRFFQKEEECPTKKEGANSSTSGTEDLEDQVSPKLEYQQFLLASKKLEEELTYKISERKEDYRTYIAYEDGGIACDDPKQVDKLRSVGKEMVKIIGRKIFSGQFNLTKISFPIRACHPKTALYNSIACCSTFPYFMNAAAKTKDPVERFKLVTSCFLSTPYYLNMFLKPLNPILGETLQATLIDGTQIYAEQISHHPPVSYFLVVGPGGNYRFSGFYDFDVKPGLNSLTLKNKGKRRVEFKDGGVIEGTYSTNEFSATFIGTSRIEEIGECKFEDSQNGLTCFIEFGKVKKRPSDYFQSTINRHEKPIVKLFGTYCGYLEFDGVRYWDGRDIQPLHIELKKNINLLPSDWSYRIDIQQFLRNPDKLDDAQKSKEHLEEIQRNDAKLRKHMQEFLEKEAEQRKKEMKKEEEERKKEEKKREKQEKKDKEEEQKKEKKHKKHHKKEHHEQEKKEKSNEEQKPKKKTES